MLAPSVHSARTTDANASATPRRSTVAFLRPVLKTEPIEVDSDQARSPSFATTAAAARPSSMRPIVEVKTERERKGKADNLPEEDAGTCPRKRKGKRKFLSALSTTSSSSLFEIAPLQSDTSTDFSSLSDHSSTSKNDQDSSPSASSVNDTSQESSSEDDDDDDDDGSNEEDTSSSSSTPPSPSSAPTSSRTAPRRAAAQRASLSWKKAMLQRVEPVWRARRSSSSRRTKRSPTTKDKGVETSTTPRPKKKKKKMTTLMLAQRALQVDRDAREQMERKRLQRQQQQDDGNGKEKEKEEGKEEEREIKEQGETQEQRERVPLVMRIEHRSTCPPELEGSRVWTVFCRYEQHYWELVHAGIPPNSAKPFRLTKEDQRMLSEREKNQFRYLRDRFQKKKDQLQHRERRKREKRRQYSQWRQENESAPDKLNKYRVRSWRAQLSIKLSKALLKKRISWDGWTHRDEVRMAYFLSLPQRSQNDKLVDRYLRFRTEAEKTAARETAAAGDLPPTRQVP